MSARAAAGVSRRVGGDGGPFRLRGVRILAVLSVEAAGDADERKYPRRSEGEPHSTGRGLR